MVSIPAGPAVLRGELTRLPASDRFIVFAQGSAASRHSPRNQAVARELHDTGFGTLLCDLLSDEEEAADGRTSALRFDVGLLSARLLSATRWLRAQFGQLRLGYFGVNSGAAAALAAAAEDEHAVAAIVSRGGRPDLAGEALPHVRAPTLLLVGSHDGALLDLNRYALEQLRCEKSLHLMRGATYRLEEPAVLAEIARQAIAWFRRFMPRQPS
ncbi:MAG TPA: alpha/beta hydrolase [Nevskia sp.]|nr:alpha/beta hydrolase [Nevskia sp.]